MSAKHGQLKPFDLPTTRELALLADLYLAEGNHSAAENCIAQIYEIFDAVCETENATPCVESV